MTTCTSSARLRPYVLQLLATARIGGTERSVIELVKNGEAADCNFAAAVMEPQGPLVAELERLAVPVFRWPLPTVARHLSLVRRRLAGFDCIHAYGMRPSLLARFLAWPHRVPVIVGQESIDLFRPAWHFRLERLTSPLVAHYVAKFEAGKQVLQDRAGISPARISVVYNGIDVQPFLETPPREATLPIIISSVANLRPVKRHDRLLRAFAMARAMLSSEAIDIRLRLVGEGHCRPDLERLAAELGIDGAIDFLGYRSDIVALLQASDIVILTSDYEGLPLSLIEGMASGCAIVAPRVGGIPELVTSGEQGLLVDSDGRTEREYAQALVTLCRDPDLRLRLGAAARKQVRANFSAAKMSRLLGDVYREVAAFRSSHR